MCVSVCFGVHRFFVVEDTILHTTQELGPHKGEGEGLVTRAIVHEFWQMALSEVLAVLRNNCVSVTMLSSCLLVSPVSFHGS